MLQKFKITTCVFILCLFGLTLMTVSPVFAADSAAFKQCQQIKPHGKFGPMKQKKNCFRDLARILSKAAPQQKEPQMIIPVEGGPQGAGREAEKDNDLQAILENRIGRLSYEECTAKYGKLNNILTGIEYPKEVRECIRLNQTKLEEVRTVGGR